MTLNRKIQLGALALLLLLTGCSSQKKYIYIEDAPRDEEMTIVNNYQTTIFPGDQLYIYVYSQNQIAVRPFNEETRNATTTDNQANMYTLRKKELKGYIVDGDGNIQFPVLGTINTTDMTLDALGNEIKARLVEGRYVKDPLVTVSLMNFRVTVVGEVTNPRLLHGTGNRMTIDIRKIRVKNVVDHNSQFVIISSTYRIIGRIHMNAHHGNCKNQN